MARQKILFVSHCILNTAAKVARTVPIEQTAEEAARQALLSQVQAHNIQIVQLPCPEFTLYGPSRWGHVKEQFDNPFFQDHCRTLLVPILQQLRAYLQHRDRFQVLGFVGIEGSPSCGVNRTCSGAWGGEFSGRSALPACTRIPERGVFMAVLAEELAQMGLSVPIVGLDRAEALLDGAGAQMSGEGAEG